MNGRGQGPGPGGRREGGAGGTGPGGRGPRGGQGTRGGPPGSGASGHSGGGPGSHGAPNAGDPPTTGHRALRREVATALLQPGVLEQVSPGFYFQRCLKLWNEGLRDVTKEKREAVRPMQAPQAMGARVVRGEPELHRALLARQAGSFEALRASAQGGLVKRLRGVTPFVTGIGQAHPLETGFAFLKPHGVPYLAASGVKGAVRAACAADWKEALDKEGRALLLQHYFGSEDKNPDPAPSREEPGHRRGALVFFDLLPDVPANAPHGWADVLRLDIVNPHYGDYYQGKSVPADWLSPVPSYFLTLRPGLEWSLYVLYAPVGEAARTGWQEEIEPGLLGAFTANGLGAKKSWGYGLFDVLPEAAAAPSSPPTAHGGAQPASSGPGSPAAGAAVEAARDFIASLRASEVKANVTALERALRACPRAELPALLTEVERKLTQLGLHRREIRDVLQRVRRTLGLKSA